MGMNASLWNQAGELPDRDDEPEEVWPAVGQVYELVVAVAQDGKALVIEAPEEFWTAVRDSDGSLHLEDWFPIGTEPGVYRIRARYRFEAGRGEFGSHDPSSDEWWFEPEEFIRLALVPVNQDWTKLPGVA